MSLDLLRRSLLLVTLLAAACPGPSKTDGGSEDAGPDAGPDAGAPGWDGGPIPWVFVIAFENQDTASVFDAGVAPYINGTLLPAGGSASNYQDCLSGPVPSEPHYVWMEAGTNVFPDIQFQTDKDPSTLVNVGKYNVTADHDHLTAWIADAGTGVTWMTYQEDLDGGDPCPINSHGFFASKHDPFVFFADVVGDPPSPTSPQCVAHHRDYAQFAADLASMQIGHYTFITPNLCNDMHGANACANGCVGSSTIAACVTAGDTWLRNNLPPILSFVQTNGGAVFLVWDEPEIGTTNPFVALGPHVKAGYLSGTAFTHSGLQKSLSEILGLPVSPRVSSATDFSEFFQPGYFP